MYSKCISHGQLYFNDHPRSSVWWAGNGVIQSIRLNREAHAWANIQRDRHPVRTCGGYCFHFFHHRSHRNKKRRVLRTMSRWTGRTGSTIHRWRYRHQRLHCSTQSPTTRTTRTTRPCSRVYPSPFFFELLLTGAVAAHAVFDKGHESLLVLDRFDAGNVVVGVQPFVWRKIKATGHAAIHCVHHRATNTAGCTVATAGGAGSNVGGCQYTCGKRLVCV